MKITTAVLFALCLAVSPASLVSASPELNLQACPATIDPSRPDRTVVQTIGGTLFEWGEFELGPADNFCVVLNKPSLKALSVENARLLLEASLGALEQDTSHGVSFTTRSPASNNRVAPRQRSVATRGVLALSERAALQDRSSGLAKTNTGSSATRRKLSASRLADLALPAPSTKKLQPLLFGNDGRIRVTDTESFPWRTIVYVESEFPNGQIFGFSGVMIGKHSVLTSALAVYQSDRGGFATSVLVVPGQAQAQEGATIIEPYGSQFGEFIEVPQAWIDTESATDIYGVVLLEEAFAGINNTMPLAFNALPAGEVNLAGYDQTAQGEIDSYSQWTRSGELTNSDSVYVDHKMDDDAGAIGAPLYELFQNGSRRIVALNCCVTQDESANVALRLTSDNQALISEWAAYAPDNGGGGGGGGGGNPDPDPSAPPLSIGGTSSDRFRITVGWEKPDGTTGSGQPIELTSDTGYFWFFRDDNVEFLIKVLNGCTINDHYWVFAGGLTDVQVSVLVEDTQTGTKWRAFNPQGQGFESIQDISALPVCP